MGIKDLKIDELKLADISTTIPEDVRDYIKSKGYKYNDLIRLGLLAKEDNPQLIERISDIERKYECIKNALVLLQKSVDMLLRK